LHPLTNKRYDDDHYHQTHRYTPGRLMNTLKLKYVYTKFHDSL